MSTTLEGALAVISATVAEASPVMLQLHPASLRHGGIPLLAACLSAVRDAAIPAAVHLDHSSQRNDIAAALASGVESVLADGSGLGYAENVTFTRCMTDLAHRAGACVEAKLGRLSGVEDGIGVSEREAKMTDPALATEFVAAAGVDCLAVCVGNVHGPYAGDPQLDFRRLAAIRTRVPIPLVLHGASGLPETVIRRSIDLGVAKFNVNAELRGAYLTALRRSMASGSSPELLDLIKSAVAAMQAVVQDKLQTVWINRKSHGPCSPGCGIECGWRVRTISDKSIMEASFCLLGFSESEKLPQMSGNGKESAMTVPITTSNENGRAWE